MSSAADRIVPLDEPVALAPLERTLNGSPDVVVEPGVETEEALGRPSAGKQRRRSAYHVEIDGGSRKDQHHATFFGRHAALITHLVAFMAYILVGFAFYSKIEGWTFVDCTYFAIVTSTSVGYGDLLPSTDGSKMFTSLYAFVGVGLIAEALFEVARFIYELQQHVTSKATLAMLKHSLQAKKSSAKTLSGLRTKIGRTQSVKTLSAMKTKLTGTMTDAASAIQPAGIIADQTTAGVEAAGKMVMGAARGMQDAGQKGTAAVIQGGNAIRRSVVYQGLMMCLPLLLYLFSGQIMGRIEGWNFVDTLYYSCISTATVGYGDFYPATQRGRVFAIFYIPIGVVISLNLFARLGLAYAAHQHKDKVELSTLLSIDTDGDGAISELEFTVYMLRALKKVDSDVLEAIHKKFIEISDGKTEARVADLADRDLVLVPDSAMAML